MFWYSFLPLFLPNDGIAEDLLLEKPQMIQNTHCCPYVHIIAVILSYCSFAVGKENNNNLAINRLQLQTTIWQKQSRSEVKWPLKYGRNDNSECFVSFSNNRSSIIILLPRKMARYDMYNSLLSACVIKVAFFPVDRHIRTIKRKKPRPAFVIMANLQNRT